MDEPALVRVRRLVRPPSTGVLLHGTPRCSLAEDVEGTTKQWTSQANLGRDSMLPHMT